MPLIPFSSQHCRVLRRTSNMLFVEINSAASPMWIVPVGMALYQDSVPGWPVLCLIGIAFTWRKYLLIDVASRQLTIGYRLFAAEYRRKVVSICDIQDVHVVRLDYGENGIQYCVVLSEMSSSGITREVRILERYDEKESDRIAGLLRSYCAPASLAVGAREPLPEKLVDSIEDEFDLSRRAFAAMCDYALYSMIVVVYVIYCGQKIASGMWLLMGPHHFVILALIWVLYFPIMESLFGFTLFKGVFDLRVALDKKSDIRLFACFKRHLADPIDYGPLGLVALILARTNPARKRLGDKWGRTHVTRDV
jgi:uncharacterized RDD family membrane protein YckC